MIYIKKENWSYPSLHWLVPLQSTHWSNSLVDAWSLDPTLQWLFMLFFYLVLLLFLFFSSLLWYHRVETDGRVIRNETTCNYRRDWRSHPCFFCLFIYLFSRKRNGGIVSSDQNGGERRYRGTDRPHPARGQRRSTGATSRRFGERREQTAQPNTGIY